MWLVTTSHQYYREREGSEQDVTLGLSSWGDGGDIVVIRSSLLSSLIILTIITTTKHQTEVTTRRRKKGPVSAQ